MFDFAKVSVGLRVGRLPEFLPPGRDLLQLAHRCTWPKACAEQGRVNLHDSSGGSVCANRGHLRPPLARLLQCRIAALGRRRDLGDAGAWDSSK